MSSLESIVEWIFVFAYGAAFASVLSAIVVRVTTKLVARFTPPFGAAYMASFFGFSLGSAVSGAGEFVLSAFGIQASVMISRLIMLMGFFPYAGILGLMIKHPETGPIGFGKGCLVLLIAAMICIGVYIGISSFFDTPMFD